MSAHGTQGMAGHLRSLLELDLGYRLLVAELA
jgi:hypothetical protein